MDQPIVAAGHDVMILGGEITDRRTYQVQVQNAFDLLHLLEQHSATNAIHTSKAVDSQNMCLPGTRTFTLGRLRSLLSPTDSDPGQNIPDAGSDIVWLRGPAGAGKSAIMRTIANELDEGGVLLASFFFHRADRTRNKSTPFIPTLASQAISCNALPGVEPHVADLIRKKRGLFFQSIRNQARLLLEGPLLEAIEDGAAESGAGTPLVVMVDGLDECSEPRQQVEIINTLVHLAATVRSNSNRRLKILIASRPEDAIKTRFETLDNGTVAVVNLDTHDPSDANIDLFYDTQLEKIRRRHRLPKTWPSHAQMLWLRRKTSGHYSFAHASTEFLNGGDPVARLEMLQKKIPTHPDLRPFDSLDALYATVFNQLPPEMLRPALFVVRMRLALEASTFLTPPRAGSELNAKVEDILGLTPGYITNRLSLYLASLINFDNPEVFLPHHASLGDFLTSSERSSVYGLFVDDVTIANAVVSGLVKYYIWVRPEVIDDTTFWNIVRSHRPPCLNLVTQIHQPDIANALQIVIERIHHPDVALRLTAEQESQILCLVRELRQILKDRPDALDSASVEAMDVIDKALNLPHLQEDRLLRLGLPEEVVRELMRGSLLQALRADGR